MSRVTPESSGSNSTAQIVEWDRQKGYGFLQVGKRRVFLHHRDFAARHKKPAVGDKISFTLGQDAQGRSCARNATHPGGRLYASLTGLLLLVVLLVLPAIALLQRQVDLRWVGGYGVLLSLLTYWVYAADKRRAREGAWRISEGQLHLMELMGGWPGAWLAQQRLQHKCTKRSFQFVFWLIVLSYQIAAVDSLKDWRLSRLVLEQIEVIAKQRR